MGRRFGTRQSTIQMPEGRFLAQLPIIPAICKLGVAPPPSPIAPGRPVEPGTLPAASEWPRRFARAPQCSCSVSSFSPLIPTSWLPPSASVVLRPIGRARPARRASLVPNCTGRSPRRFRRRQRPLPRNRPEAIRFRVSVSEVLLATPYLPVMLW